MEVGMIATIKWIAPIVAVAFPLTVLAQGNDAAYCKALSDKYEAFIANMKGHSNQPGGADGDYAVQQCKAGNPGAAIPILEKKLNDAKIELPKRS
jgi:hypothetical protein